MFIIINIISKFVIIKNIRKFKTLRYLFYLQLKLNFLYIHHISASNNNIFLLKLCIKLIVYILFKR